MKYINKYRSSINEGLIPNFNYKWTKNNFESFFIDRKEIKKREYELIKLLEYYLFYNPELLPNDEYRYDLNRENKNKNQIILTYDIFSIFMFHEKLVIKIAPSNTKFYEEIILQSEELEDFFQFLQNPEAYKEIKKYNL